MVNRGLKYEGLKSSDQDSGNNTKVYSWRSDADAPASRWKVHSFRSL